MSEKVGEREPSEGHGLHGVLFDMCSAELVIRTRIGNASENLSRHGVICWNQTQERAIEELARSLAEQTGIAITWHAGKSEKHADHNKNGSSQEGAASDQQLQEGAFTVAESVELMGQIMGLVKSNSFKNGKKIPVQQLSQIFVSLEALTRRSRIAPACD
ncbi:hypothetical protein ACQFN5_24860 [Klebsiella sp. WOUb02]|uniref:hypothetical protein n=1 Tax=Klebsiella sp. WOUb02 TaxID=3161071 RepID=UPI003CEEA0E5